MNISTRSTLWSALAVLSLFSAQALGQAQPQRIRFETTDEVEISGRFYAGNKQSPTVVILHKMGGKSQTKELSKVAADLSAKGYAVLLFDFRGHGGSTNVGTNFFDARKYPFNSSGVKSYRGPVVALKNQPNQISYKDFKTAYYPYIINDLAAAKLFLEQRNDAGDCNASNLILMCEEDSCILSMMWAAAETFRYKVTIDQFGRPMAERKPQSRDIVSMVFLSPNYRLAGNSYANPMRVYCRLLKDQEIGVALVYGEEDDASEKVTKFLLRDLKDKKAQRQITGEHVVKKTELKGSKLLIDATKATDWIIGKYLEGAIKNVQAINVWEKRETNDATYWWDFIGNGRIPPASQYAKVKGERHVRPLPVRTVVTNPNLEAP